jgi:hypothetical protein
MARKYKQKELEAKIGDMVDWIGNYLLNNGYPPTKDKICAAMEIHHTTMLNWLKEAEGMGMIETQQIKKPYRHFLIPGIYFVDDRIKNEQEEKTKNTKRL